MRRVFLFLAGIAAFSAVTGRTLADEPEDDVGAAKTGPAVSAAVESALADMQAGAYDTACPALKKAYREDERPSTIFHIAKCYDAWGRIATAAVHYDTYLAAFDRLTPTEQKEERDREEEASGRRQALEKRIPKVVLKVPNDAPGATRVLRRGEDGTTMIALALGIPLPIDPGEHVLTTESPGRPTAFTKFVL